MVGFVASVHLLSVDLTEFFLDIVLPKTDRVVFIQWIVAAIFWPPVLWLTRKLDRDIRHFIYGLAMMNLALFAARTVH